jgi:hypothetical protein
MKVPPEIKINPKSKLERKANRGTPIEGEEVTAGLNL